MENSRLTKAEMLDILAAYASGTDRSVPVPKGWYTISDIRQELGFSYNRNASSRAFELYQRGVLERRLYRARVSSGHCHQTYIYRPKPPFKTITEAAFDWQHVKADKVPAGWIRAVDYARKVGVSVVAVRGAILRRNLKGRMFRTRRGVSGLHMNLHFREAELDRIYAR